MAKDTSTEAEAKVSYVGHTNGIAPVVKNPDGKLVHPGVDDFMWAYTDEPHATRRQAILAKYPEIKKLYGNCISTAYISAIGMALQLFLAYYTSTRPVWELLLVAYVVGGTSAQLLMFAIHEGCHNLIFKKFVHNKVFGMVADLFLGVPSSVSFKRYHSDHHRYLGVEGMDVDLPTALEGEYINTTFRKLVMVFFYSLFYVFRPFVVNPKKPGKWEVANGALCAVFDAFICYLWGPWATLYLLLSTFFGAGLHPMAGHFISEHYVFEPGVETYSYYGVLNYLSFNFGHHNEHHDFPYVPGPRLPQVRAMAPEFYNSLPQHSSWTKVLYDFIFDPKMSPYSRVKRPSSTAGREARDVQTKHKSQ